MKVRISTTDGICNIIYCNYVRARDNKIYFYSDDWLAHYIAEYSSEEKTVKLYTPKECIDSYKCIKNVVSVNIYEDESIRKFV